MFRVIIEVLHELRVDLQDFVWLVAQQLRIDGALVRTVDRIYMIFTSKKHGRNRSIIRHIATSLPLKPLPRVRFTIVEDGEDSDSQWASSIDEGLAAIPVLDRRGKIEQWSLKSQRKSNTSTPHQESGYQDDDEAGSVRSVSPVSVGADSLYSSQSTVDTVAMNKISALEDELARLREQIAKIVVTTTGTVIGSNNIPAIPIPQPPPLPSALLPPPPLPSVPLIPPPPPPPPLVSINGADNITPLRKTSLAESLQSKTLKPTTFEKSQSTTPALPSMTDVLKDMGKVKLKKVDRSAASASAKRVEERDDPATLIALALRKRFAQMNQMCDSPEKDDREERDSFSESSDIFHDLTPKTVQKPKPPSPRKLFLGTRTEVASLSNKQTLTQQTVPFGQHLLRKTKKDA